jgi:murein DD-endopeptidase MepM/ murein hydrolase activator NlpD
MAVDGWANLKKVYIDWFAHIKNTAVDWYANTKKVVVDWYAKIKKTAVDWYANTQKVVVDWFDPLRRYVQDWSNNLQKYAEDYIAPAVAFFEDPASMIFSYLEAYAWGWAEWFLAVLLGGVDLDPPPRPKIGGMMAPPIDGPPGPGEGVPGLRWPCNARGISGYRFVPSSHNGLDIGCALGAPIWSIASGVVSAVVHSNVGYGNRVDITHDNGAWSRYAHLSRIYVWTGKQVGQGFTIGACGSTGNSSGPHLHIEIKYNGVYVDPAQVLR